MFMKFFLFQSLIENFMRIYSQRRPDASRLFMLVSGCLEWTPPLRKYSWIPPVGKEKIFT